MLTSKFPRQILKNLKSIRRDFNNYILNQGIDYKTVSYIKNIKKDFKILQLDPHLTIIGLLLLKHYNYTQNITNYHKIFLITELYCTGFTLHINVENQNFSKATSLQVLLGDFLLTKIFEITLLLNNTQILALFAEYNKKLSEGMLHIQLLHQNCTQKNLIETHQKVYGNFVKLCLNAILMLNQENPANPLLQDAEKIIAHLSQFFGNLRLYQNIFVYNFFEDKINILAKIQKNLIISKDNLLIILKSTATSNNEYITSLDRYLSLIIQSITAQ